MSKWLAAAAGASESEVSRWRKGIHVPTPATREKIAVALGLHVDDLWPPAYTEQEREAA